jgi:hypothetical protein
LTTINFRPPPTKEQGHAPNTTLTPSATTGAAVNFTSAANAFITGDVGRIIEYGAGRASITAYTTAKIVVCDIIDAFPDTDPIPAGDWTILYSPNAPLTPSSIKKGTICNLNATGLAVFRATEDVGKYVFINGGCVKLKTYDMTGFFSGEVVYDLIDLSTATVWTMESEMWDSTNGFPSVGFFFEQRLVTAGCPTYPQTLNFSVSGDYENFTRDPEADDAAMEYTLVSNQVEGIHWLAGSDYLLIGTFGGVWRFGASSVTDPLTQVNVSAKKQSNIGVRDLAALPITDSILWTDISGRAINRAEFSFEKDKYVAINMARIASHITLGATREESGVVDLAFQQAPFPIVWAVRADGQLLGMTYETQENIYAWFRIPTDGWFESVAVISNGGEEDQIWVIVRRLVEGVTKRYVEYFKPIEFFSQIEDGFFVHSGVTYDGGAAVTITGITRANPAVVSAVNTFSGGELIRVADVEGMTQANTGLTRAWTVANPTGATFELSGIDSSAWGAYTGGGTARVVQKDFTTGLAHLEGVEVDILIDGAVHPRETVAGGELHLNWYGNLVHVGRPAPAILSPTKPYLEISGGSSRGKKQRVAGGIISFYETYGGECGPSLDDLNALEFGTGGTPALFTGEIDLNNIGNWGEDSPLFIKQELPLPMTIRGITYDIELYDD